MTITPPYNALKRILTRHEVPPTKYTRYSAVCFICLQTPSTSLWKSLQRSHRNNPTRITRLIHHTIAFPKRYSAAYPICFLTHAPNSRESLQRFHQRSPMNPSHWHTTPPAILKRYSAIRLREHKLEYGNQVNASVFQNMRPSCPHIQVSHTTYAHTATLCTISVISHKSQAFETPCLNNFI